MTTANTSHVTGGAFRPAVRINGVNPTYGHIISATSIEDAAIATLKLWMPDYLAEVAAQLGVPTPPVPGSYTERNKFDDWPEEGRPAVIVLSPGTRGAPRKAGDGYYRATWILNVAAVVSANTQVNTRRLCALYAAAIRAILTQHHGLNGLCDGLTWQGETYDLLGEESSRTIAASEVDFLVDVNQVVNARSGPVDPGHLLTPLVDEVSVTVTKEG